MTLGPSKHLLVKYFFFFKISTIFANIILYSYQELPILIFLAFLYQIMAWASLRENSPSFDEQIEEKFILGIF
jgi:hypothetical protein